VGAPKSSANEIEQWSPHLAVMMVTVIAFQAGTGDGHHFLNATDNDAAFLVVGDRTLGDEVTYPDIDLELKAGPDGDRKFRHKDGSPYPKIERT